MSNGKADIGLVGLAVMGENLILNMESKGFTVAAFNRTTSKVDDFVNGRAKGKKILGAHSVEEFVSLLKRPRKVMIMVKAGKAVDDFIEQILPHLEPGDMLIDGGNTHYPDTIRRTAYVEGKGMLYVGTGVSGGEEGALTGPSIMPGGSPGAWPLVKPIFQAIAAKIEDGTPCCDWVGENGAGHFVKMVHNGIEYGDMQLICEAYHIMQRVLGHVGDRDARRLRRVEQGRARQLPHRDHPRHPRLQGRRTASRSWTCILDTAGQKGTGKWTGIEALELGIPLTLIGEAVFARCLSAMKDERVAAAKCLPGPTPKFAGDRKAFVEDVRQALYASKIVSYAQGYTLMRAAAKEYGWNLNYGGVALMWRGGCIIRSVFLGKIKEAFDRDAGPLEPAARPVLPRQGRGEPARVAPRRRVGGDERRAGAGVLDGARLLRRVTAADRLPGQPAPGSARLLRRAHLRAHRQAARPVLPHQLDGPRRHDLGLDLHGVSSSRERPLSGSRAAGFPRLS